MKYAFVSLALFASVALGQNTLTIATPNNVVECEPTLLSWSGGTPPYFLSVLPGNQPSAAALESLGQQSGTSYTWATDIAAGTSIGLTIRDSTGTTASSAAFTINSGSSSCIGKSTSAASGSSAAGSSTAAGSSSAAASTTSAASSAPATTSAAATSTKPATSSSVSTTATSSSSAPATTTSSSGAQANAVNMGVAAVVGAAVMAVLA